jgi:hypothetical protein
MSMVPSVQKNSSAVKLFEATSHQLIRIILPSLKKAVNRFELEDKKPLSSSKLVPSNVWTLQTDI